MSTMHTQTSDGLSLAHHTTLGKAPHVVFLGGFMSDMSGTKATYLEKIIGEAGYGFTRFDYRGHGESEGRFTDATIGAWLADTLHILDEVVAKPCVLVGSSMGGWMMLLSALARPKQVQGLVGVAAAPDFTMRLMYEKMDAMQRNTLVNEGVLNVPSEYGFEPYPITAQLIDESRQHLLLDDEIAIECPIRLLHGMKDPDVPWEYSVQIAEAVSTHDVQVRLSKSGDHRLSEPDDLERLKESVLSVCKQVEATQ